MGVQLPPPEETPQQLGTPIEHLVTWQDAGETVIVGLDAACRPVYLTALTPS
jgi:hypothetical protein